MWGTRWLAEYRSCVGPNEGDKLALWMTYLGSNKYGRVRRIMLACISAIVHYIPEHCRNNNVLLKIGTRALDLGGGASIEGLKLCWIKFHHESESSVHTRGTCALQAHGYFRTTTEGPLSNSYPRSHLA